MGASVAAVTADHTTDTIGPGQKPDDAAIKARRAQVIRAWRRNTTIVCGVIGVLAFAAYALFAYALGQGVGAVIAGTIANGNGVVPLTFWQFLVNNAATVTTMPFVFGGIGALGGAVVGEIVGRLRAKSVIKKEFGPKPAL